MPLSKEVIIESIKTIVPDVKTEEHRKQLTVIIPKGKLIETLTLLKENNSLSFDMLTDITAIDWLNTPQRYEVVYFLYSNKNMARLRLKVPVSENDLKCPSVTGIWESANWYERETFDMYGIIFEDHPNLRRFYMPEDFNDPVSGEPLYPLRKDFPLKGIPDSLPLPPYPERFGDVE